MPGAEERITNQPNLCIGQALGGRAVTICAECPFPNPETDCPPYVAAQALVKQAVTITEQGRQVASLQEKNEALEHEVIGLKEQNIALVGRVAELSSMNAALTGENLSLLERILGLKIDSLVEGMFTPEGLKDEILYQSPELAEKLMGNRWAAVQIDVRFLNFINGVFGQNSGDSFLQHSGVRLTSIANGLMRTGPRRGEPSPVDSERRRRSDRRRAAAAGGGDAPGYTTQGDPLTRRGGDEFTVLMFDVDPENVPGIVKRIQGQLDVAAALKRAPDGMPFVASVGAAHVTEINPELMRGKDALSRYYLVDDRANEAGILAKKKQYRSMWTRLVKDSDDALRGVRQPQDRAVAEMFITTYFPGFVNNHSEILGGRQD